MEGEINATTVPWYRRLTIPVLRISLTANVPGLFKNCVGNEIFSLSLITVLYYVDYELRCGEDVDLLLPEV